MSNLPEVCEHGKGLTDHCKLCVQQFDMDEWLDGLTERLADLFLLSNDNLSITDAMNYAMAITLQFQHRDAEAMLRWMRQALDYGKVAPTD